MAYDNAGNLIEEDGILKRTGDQIVRSAKTLVGYDDRRKDEINVKRQNNFVEPDLKKEMKYPLADSGNHYVRFWINLDEESKLIKEKKVTSTGNIDNSDQNRMNTNSATDVNVFQAAVLGGAYKAGKAAYEMTKPDEKDLANRLSIFKGKGLASFAYRLGSLAGSAKDVAFAAGVGGAAAGAASLFFAENFKLSKRLKRLATSISLYIPSNISASYHLGWSQTDDIMLDITQKTQRDAVNDMLGRNLLSGPARIYMSGASEAFSNLGRTAKNPRRDMLFQYVGNRKFKFEYIFAPRSKEEAQEVANIIYTFKLFAHPELLEGYANYLYLYPAEFDIEYRMIDANGKDIENPFINKISSCVLESVDVVYANRGTYQSLANGEPLMTTLSLSFMEIETLHQEKIKQGF